MPRSAPFAVILDHVADHPKTSGTTVKQPDLQHQPQQQPQETSNATRNEAYQLVNVPDPDDIDGQVVRISISHDGDYCAAVAMAPEMPDIDQKVDPDLAAQG